MQIDWMIKGQDDLHITEGFWEGFRTENIDDVFLLVRSREAESELLLDYDQILGAAFTRCREDMRPFLPPWANSLCLEGDPKSARRGRWEQ